MILLILFFSAFGAATLLPLQSEAVLISSLHYSGYAPWLLILVASVGNILGSAVNWYLGRSLLRFQHKRWFAFSPQQIAKSQALYAKYGSGLLLLSWVPVIGDPLTLIAGFLKESWWRFLILVSIAKVSRYLVLYLGYRGIMG